MERNQIEVRLDMINLAMRFDSLVNDNILRDELCGDHAVIDADKVVSFIGKLKDQITIISNEKINGKYKDQRPLIEALLLMNKKDEQGNTNEPKAEDVSREIIMGETRQFSPFGGIKTNAD